MHRVLGVLGVLSMGAFASGCASPAEEADAEPQMAVAEPQEQAQWFGGRPTRSAELFGCKGETVVFQTANGRNYIDGGAGGGFFVWANATTVGRGETFRVYSLGGNRVALQAYNNYFVISAVGQNQQNGQVGPTGWLTSNGQGISQEGTFRVVRENGKVFLRSYAGFYITAEGGGGNVATVVWPFRGTNQGFTAICPEGDLESAEPTEEETPDDAWGTPEEPEETPRDPWATPTTPPTAKPPTTSRDPWAPPGDPWANVGPTIR